MTRTLNAVIKPPYGNLTFCNAVNDMDIRVMPCSIDCCLIFFCFSTRREWILQKQLTKIFKNATCAMQPKVPCQNSLQKAPATHVTPSVWPERTCSNFPVRKKNTNGEQNTNKNVNQNSTVRAKKIIYICHWAIRVFYA